MGKPKSYELCPNQVERSDGDSAGLFKAIACEAPGGDAGDFSSYERSLSIPVKITWVSFLFNYGWRITLVVIVACGLALLNQY